MISKRVSPFFRQITVCLTLILIPFLFVLSCQKDEGLKQKDPNALTKSQAKEYFEQTATTLKFLTAGITPTETKNSDNSLTENMVIEWEQSVEGETSDSYVVEVPIRMMSSVTALLYDGVGHLNKNIRPVQMNASLLIEKHKADGCMHHLIVITVGSYSKAVANAKYGFLCDKSSFSGYQIFNDEEGHYLKSFAIKNGLKKTAPLIPQGKIKKVDSCGNDCHFVGLSFCVSKKVLTKGGDGGSSSGEDSRCPYCGRYLSLANGVPYCSHCEEYFEDWTFTICPDCLRPIYDCDCSCPICVYPNRYGNSCMCEPGPFDERCPVCGLYGCNGQHGGGADSTIVNDTYSVIVHTNLGGYVSRSIERPYYFHNENLTLTAHPYSGYSFVGWYEDNTLLSSLSQYSFSVTESRVIYAIFDEQ